MTTETTKMNERNTLEVLNDGNYGLIDEILSTDFVEHFTQPGLPPTREGFKQGAKALRTAFPDIKYTIEDTIESGDRIVHLVKATGTMTGEFMGMPATGKRAMWNEIHIGRVANGRLVEHWALADQLGMLVQLGIVAAPGRVPALV
jgi:predicted ester cyclase